MDGAKYRRILDENLLESAMNQNWVGDSHFIRTMIRSTKLKPHGSGPIRRKLMFLSGPVKVLT